MFDAVYFNPEENEYFFGYKKDKESYAGKGAREVVDPDEIMSAIADNVQYFLNRGLSFTNRNTLVKSYITIMLNNVL